MSDEPAGSASDLLRERMQLIAEQAVRTNAERAADLRAVLQRDEAVDLSEDERTAAAAVAHQLAGSAGTFGYRRVSDSARSIEQALSDGGSPVDRTALLLALDSLDTALVAPPDEDLD